MDTTILDGWNITITTLWQLPNINICIRYRRTAIITFPEALYKVARTTGWSHILDRTSQQNSWRKVEKFSHTSTYKFTREQKNPNTQNTNTYAMYLRLDHKHNSLGHLTMSCLERKSIRKGTGCWWKHCNFSLWWEAAIIKGHVDGFVELVMLFLLHR